MTTIRGTARQKTRTTGFTLIEVMISIVVVAILTSIALPSYSSYLVRVNRSAAAQFMMDLANREEQYMMDQRSYTVTSCTTSCSGAIGARPDASLAAQYTF